MASDVDQKILAAFSKLVVQYGYQKSTTKKIAQAAGVNESTLFRHFKDKKGILKHLVHDYLDDIKTVGQDYQLVGDIEQDLMNFAIIYQDLIKKHLPLFLTDIREAGDLPELEKAIQELTNLSKEILTEKLTQMQIQGEIAPNIDIDIEIKNLILLNLGQAIMQHAFPTTTFKIAPTTFIESNVRTYASHLKP